MVGVTGTFVDLADGMNLLSRLKKNEKPELQFTRNTLLAWFHSVNGEIKKRISRPLLTKEKEEERVKWCEEML